PPWGFLTTAAWRDCGRPTVAVAGRALALATSRFGRLGGLAFALLKPINRPPLPALGHAWNRKGCRAKPRRRESQPSGGLVRRLGVRRSADPPPGRGSAGLTLPPCHLATLPRGRTPWQETKP